MSNTPTALTKKRIEALLAYAGRGEDEIVAYAEDEWEVDISGSDELIRYQIKHSEADLPQSSVWEAVAEYRAYRDAREILSRRYLR